MTPDRGKRWTGLWNLFDLTPEGRPDWDEQLNYE